MYIIRIDLATSGSELLQSGQKCFEIGICSKVQFRFREYFLRRPNFQTAVRQIPNKTSIRLCVGSSGFSV
jgi:hypothetical protein